MKRAVNSIPLLYALMLFSGMRPLVDLIHGEWYYPQMMTETGLLSVCYLSASLAVTPVLLLISRLGRGAVFGQWLLQRRKHFGLASFIFAAAHLLHYIRYSDGLIVAWLEAFDLPFLVGWIAFIVLAILALTSNKGSIRRLKRFWKTLHRLVYIAAALTFWHWYLFDEVTSRVLFWLAVLVIPKLVHIGLRLKAFKSVRRTPV